MIKKYKILSLFASLILLVNVGFCLGFSKQKQTSTLDTQQIKTIQVAEDTAPQVSPTFEKFTGEPARFEAESATILYEIDAGNDLDDNPYIVETIYVRDSNTNYLYKSFDELIYDSTSNRYAGIITIENLIPDSNYMVDISADLESGGTINYTYEQAYLITASEQVVDPEFTSINTSVNSSDLLTIDYTANLGTDAEPVPFIAETVALVDNDLETTLDSNQGLEIIHDIPNNNISGTLTYQLPVDNADYKGFYLILAGDGADLNSQISDAEYYVIYPVSAFFAEQTFNYQLWVGLGVGLGILLIIIITVIIGYFLYKKNRESRKIQILGL